MKPFIFCTARSPHSQPSRTVDDDTRGETPPLRRAATEFGSDINGSTARRHDADLSSLSVPLKRPRNVRIVEDEEEEETTGASESQSASDDRNGDEDYHERCQRVRRPRPRRSRVDPASCATDSPPHATEDTTPATTLPTAALQCTQEARGCDSVASPQRPVTAPPTGPLSPRLAAAMGQLTSASPATPRDGGLQSPRARSLRQMTLKFVRSPREAPNSPIAKLVLSPVAPSTALRSAASLPSAEERAPPATRRSRKTAAAAATADGQTYLDLGQKGLLEATTCKECGMVWWVGAAEPLWARHSDIHHAKKTRGKLCFDHCQPLRRKPSVFAVPIAKRNSHSPQ